MKKLFTAAIALSLLSLHSCKKDDNTPEHVFKGTPATLGNGRAWSWVENDDQNHPVNVGITFDKAAFENLPSDDHAGHELEYTLTLPSQKAITIFDHVAINWNPHGHPPEHVYDKPHFDLHFYMMSESDRMAIPEYTEDSSGFLNYPAPAYLPATYIPIPGGEAMMGTHWADINSPELSQTNPQPFTQTFIYGSYAGNVTFYEPMATLDFLKTTKSYTRDIPQPSRFSKDGYYPTKMSYTDKGTTMEITLHDFVYHQKS